MDELTRALETVLECAIRLGIPVAMLFTVGCLIQYRDVLRRFVSRLTERTAEKGAMPSA